MRAYAYLNVDHPVVAWGTYRGALVSGRVASPAGRPVSMMFAGIIHSQDNARLDREASIEFVRQRRFPDCVSRLEGMYFFADKADAGDALSWGAHFRAENLAEVDLFPAGTPTRTDSRWISKAETRPDGRFLNDEPGWIDDYWRMESHPSGSAWETIMHGRALVRDITIRERAYDLLAREFPSALDALEIARIGAAVGSDLGQVAAFIADCGDGIYRLEHRIDFRDATNPSVLERIREHIHVHGEPINVKDLAPGREVLCLPDLRRFGCNFRVASVEGRPPLTAVEG